MPRRRAGAQTPEEEDRIVIDGTGTEVKYVVRLEGIIAGLRAEVDRQRNLADTYFKISQEQAETIERQVGEIARLNAQRPETLSDLMKQHKLCVKLEFELR